MTKTIPLHIRNGEPRIIDRWMELIVSPMPMSATLSRRRDTETYRWRFDFEMPVASAIFLKDHPNFS